MANNEVYILLLGWILGLVSSLSTGLFMFWLDGKRQLRREKAQQRQSDIRNARNWASEGKKHILKGYDLSGANLSGIDLSGADLEDANLSNAQMWATNLSNAKLIRANFENAVLDTVNLQGANLHSAIFDKATIRRSDFSKAFLRRTKLGTATLVEGCIWKDIKIDETTELGKYSAVIMIAKEQSKENS